MMPRPKCKDCSNSDAVSLRIQRFKNGQTRVRIDCGKCGNFSHYVPLPAGVEEAIALYGLQQRGDANREVRDKIGMRIGFGEDPLLEPMLDFIEEQVKPKPEPKPAKITYVCWGGHVKSKRDGQIHYISAQALPGLYNVPVKQCIFEPHHDILPARAVHLHPDSYGKYLVPAG